MKTEKKHDNHGLKTLTLSLKQTWFDQILAGTKKQEFREIRPTTEKKYILLDEDGYAVEDKNIYVWAETDMVFETVPCNGGYALTRTVEGKEILEPIVKQKGEDGEEYECVTIEDETYKCYMAVDDNGEVVLGDNGNPLYALIIKIYNSVPVHYDAIRFYTGQMNGERDTALVKVVGAHTEFILDEDGFPLYNVIGTDDNGEPIKYYVEQIVYDLGEIIEKTIYPKK